MTPKWSQKSIKAGLSNVVIFCSFSTLGQEAAKMGPGLARDGSLEVPSGRRGCAGKLLRESSHQSLVYDIYMVDTEVYHMYMVDTEVYNQRYGLMCGAS